MQQRKREYLRLRLEIFHDIQELIVNMRLIGEFHFNLKLYWESLSMNEMTEIQSADENTIFMYLVKIEQGIFHLQHACLLWRHWHTSVKHIKEKMQNLKVTLMMRTRLYFELVLKKINRIWNIYLLLSVSWSRFTCGLSIV